MSKESGELKESDGQMSTQSHAEDSDSSFVAVMSFVSTHKEKPQMDRLSAFLQAQKQGFEYEDTERLYDIDAEYLKAENQKRVKEMLQKAQEELQKRKEKCSEEDIENNKELKIPDNEEDHNTNLLEVFHKMVWLQNQNLCSEFRRSCRTNSSNMNMEESKLQSLPLKQQDKDEYFSCAKQMKAKGRRKNRCEDQQRPILGTAVKQSHGKPFHGCSGQEHMYETSLPELTCWQKKAGADLFTDVSTQKLTIQGPKEIEDELLKLAIDESLKAHRLGKLSSDFMKANCSFPLCLNPNNSEEMVQFPLKETVEDESWDPPERIDLGEITPAGSSQIQGILGNRTECQDNEMGAKKPQFSEHSGNVIPSKQKTGVSRKYKTIARNQIVSDRRESDSSSEESDVSIVEVRQPRSKYKVDTDNDNNFNNPIKGKCEEGMWGPYGNEVCNSYHKDNGHVNKKQDNVWKSPVHKPHRNTGENESCMPEVSGNRTQVLVEWSQDKHPTENWDEQQDHSLLQTGPDAYKDRGEIMSKTYLLEAGDKGTEEQVDQNQKLAHAEIRKGDQDHNLLVRLPGTGSVSQGCMPEAQVQADWNLEKNVAEIWKVHSDHVPVPLDKAKGIPEEAAQGQEGRDGRNWNCISRNLLYCSDEKQMADRNNECDGNKRLGEIWIDSVSQDADIGRTKGASSFVWKERQNKPEKRMIDNFLGKESQDPGMYMFTDYDSKVQNYLNKYINKMELSPDVNHNSYLQVRTEQSFSCNPVSIQNTPENAQMLSSSCNHDALMHQTHNLHVPSACSTSQVHHAASSFLPPMTSAVGCLPTMVGIGNQPHVQHAPNQALEPCSQSLPVPNIQELFEVFVQEQLQQLMSMNRIVQMAVKNSTGFRNINPPCLQNPQSDLKLQAQQMNSLPGSAAPINLHRRLPPNYSDLLLQSNNTSFNQSLAALSNPSPFGGIQVEAPKNIPVQCDVSLSCNRSGNTVQVPNSDMYCSGTVSPDASQTNHPNMSTNNAHSMPLNTPAIISNHGTHTKHPPWISPLEIGPSYMTPQNYQSSRPYQPAVGSMQNIQGVSPDMYSQPPGLRPVDEFTSVKMVMGKGRGRLRP